MVGHTVSGLIAIVFNHIFESQVRLGTDPNDADSNGDGTPDGYEIYTQEVVSDIASVVLDGMGDLSKTTHIYNASDHAGLSEMPGSLGNIVDIQTTSQYANVTIHIPYNEFDLAGVSEDDLKIYFFNETDHSIEFLDVQGVDTANNVVWGQTDHLSSFGIMSYSVYMNMWNSGSDPTIPEFSAGDVINVNAKVRNIGDTTVNENVLVYFYESDPDAGGRYLGSDTITSEISPGGYRTATLYSYTITSPDVDIYVKIDPLNSISELSELNNLAFRSFTVSAENFDSDGDGLTDFDETNGMRSTFGIIYTDPYDSDSDGDGLSDGEEMGSFYDDRYHLNSYPTRIHSDGDTIADSDEPEFGTDPLREHSDWDNLKDDFELSIGTNPLVVDTDFDGIDDWSEWDNPDYDPLVYGKHYSYTTPYV